MSSTGSPRKVKRREKRAERRKRLRRRKRDEGVGGKWDYLMYAEFMKKALRPPWKVKTIGCKLDKEEVADLLQRTEATHFVVLRYHPVNCKEYKCLVLHRLSVLSFDFSVQWIEAKRQLYEFIVVTQGDRCRGPTSA